MLFLSIIHHYLLWHYSQAFYELLHLWKNFLWFIINFFSLPQLMKSWFSPWKRIVEERGNKWDLEDLAGYIIVGIVSRIIGFILRTIVISLGLICLLITIIAGIVTYLFWLVAPLAIIVLLGLGIKVLIA